MHPPRLPACPPARCAARHATPCLPQRLGALRSQLAAERSAIEAQMADEAARVAVRQQVRSPCLAPTAALKPPLPPGLARFAPLCAWAT